MEQLNILEYQEELKRKRLQRLLQDKKAIANLIYTSVAIVTGCIVTFPVSRGIAIGSTIPNILSLKSLYRKEKNQEIETITGALRATTTYSDLKYEYEEYIKDIAKIIRYIGLKSPKEILIYLQNAMEIGIFSINSSHEYKIHKYEYDYVDELYGAKVITGKSVCRHMSSFFCDILTELGYTAANVHCAINKEDPFKSMRKNKVVLNHAVVGVVENGEKVIFDPTGGLFAVVPTTLDNKEDEFIHVSEYLPERKSYLIMNPSLKVNNTGREGTFQTLNSTRLSKMTVGELEYLENRIDKIIKGSLYLVGEFFITHQPQAKRIAELYQELSPYGEEPINKWLVRR